MKQKILNTFAIIKSMHAIVISYPIIKFHATKVKRNEVKRKCRKRTCYARTAENLINIGFAPNV